MTILNSTERRAHGSAVQTQILGKVQPAPKTLLDQSWQEFVYAQVWERPGLDRRSRYLIAMAGAALAAAKPSILEAYAYGALSAREFTLAELREAALQLAVYAGWTRAQAFDDAVTAAAANLGQGEAETPALRSQNTDLQAARDFGVGEFSSVMTMPPAPPRTPYYNAIQTFVFGEMWCRRELDQRARRWITLVSVCEGGAEMPIKTHIHAAMGTRDVTPEELQEFVLQYGLHAGWPKASLVQAVVDELIGKIEAGLTWDGREP
jgi:4-carboxymuconolactone decarboxylase